MHARFQCDVEGKESAYFTVPLKDLSICMRGVAGHYTMQLMKPRGREEVQIVSRDGVSDSKVNTCTIKLLDQDFERA